MVNHPHEVLLGPPRDLAAWPDQGSGAPAILQRSDDRFIEAVLAALRDPAGRVALRDDLARSEALATGVDSARRASHGRTLFDRLRAASGHLGLAGA
ncbi:hypothetical protein C667_22309, partial [Thauera phenylacetica B4P]